ncbi:MAG TPA: SDR family oxidoreductase [Thermoplasmata archaeon]|nr:SDR family oxidoreductase [Thermoplasmata archaeon]
MPAHPPSDDRPVLLVGATGSLGGQILRQLLSRGKTVRALVRPGSDVSGLPTERVEIVRGDMLDPASLAPAMSGVSAVVSSAIGYSRRRETDSLRTDTEGNRHLVDAAKKAGVPKFVFLSILACDQAREVPHFWAKKETEDHLAKQGVPFVALRPGAFLGGPWVRAALENGRVFGMTPAGIRITYIAPAEVARALSLAVDDPRALGRRIDLGSDRALSGPELADLLGGLLGRPLELSPMAARDADMLAMVRFFHTGKYVADTRVQQELFGPVPKIEEAARRMLVDFGLLPGTAGR